MRILRLDLKAFGPFTDVTLDLSSVVAGGLHVIYGANEAGKSSARRALCNLFYGFEQRTSDAYLHSYENLRIGALIEAQRTTRYVERRKARKGSLRDELGEVLDDAVLERALGGVNRATFLRTFGLGHEELRAGGEEMLRGEASVGETLFEAGRGGPGVRRLREFLESESDKLYRPRGKQQELNALLERHEEAKRRRLNAVLEPESHKKQQESLKTMQADLAALGAKIEGLREEQYRLDGLLNSLPALERRAAVLAELAPLASVPDVPESARERRESAQKREAEARARAAKLEEEIARARRRLAEIEIPGELLALGADRVGALADAVGRTRKAREDLPRIVDQKKRLEVEMAERLRRAGRETRDASPAALRVPPAESARIKKLATLRDKLDERVEGARRRVGETELKKAELEKRLARLPQRGRVEALARVAAQARSLGDVEAPLAELAARGEELDRALLRKLRELSPFRGDAQALSELVPPAAEVVERLVADATDLRDAERALADEVANLARRLADASARTVAVAAGGDVPTLRELEEARTERDREAEAFAAELRAGGGFSEPSWQRQRDLVQRADVLSDRLRREADRVAQLAQAEAERAALAGEKERLEREREALRQRGEEHRRELEMAAAPLGIVPGSPVELRGFLRRREETLEIVERRRQIAKQCSKLEASREKLRRALEEALGPSAPSDALSVLVERAAAIEKVEARRDSERSEIEHSLDALSVGLEHERAALERAEGELSTWREDWTQALSALGAGESLEPEAALALLEDLSGLAERSERIDGYEQRIQGIRRDELKLYDEVKEPARLLGIAADPDAPDRAANEIVERFRAAQSALEERGRLEADLKEREIELSAQRETLDAARRELSALAEQAGVRDPSELPAVERTSARARELRHTLETIESGLIARGRSVADLVEEAKGESAPRLQARLDQIERDALEAEEQRAAAHYRVAQAQAGLLVQTEATGADLLQEEQALAAAVRDRVERYARLRVASVLLERAVERYRLANQGPVLRRAGELFSRLTGGAYERLLVGRDEHAIVALAPDGRELAPDALSEGTRYQLYLSLRLASIERHVASAEPMPLVLDDAIIHFDDERKLAALQVLSELSANVQVLFFTHLVHDVSLARKVAEAAPGRVAFHELGAERARPSREQPIGAETP